MEKKFFAKINNGNTKYTLYFGDKKNLEEFEEMVFNCIKNPKKYTSVIYTGIDEQTVFPAKFLNESVITFSKSE